MSKPLSRLSRLLLWEYERGSLPYDLLCLVLFLVMLAPGGWWGDPMVPR